MEPHYLKLNSQNIFSPKFTRGYSSSNIRARRLLNNYPKTTKYSSNTISDFYSKNYIPSKNSLLISSNNFNLYTPKRHILNNNIRNIKSSKPRVKSSSFQKLLPSVINNQNRNMTQNKFCLETEKLYHETYQIKKVIKQLEKQLFFLSHENLIKDEQLYEKEQEINNIINNNYKSFDEEYNDDFNINNNNNYNDINMNNLKSSMGVLILKIKKEIKNTNNEIKNENYKLNYLKRSLYITKIKELSVESRLLQQQFSKINTLIENALNVKEQNDKTMEEYDNLKDNLNRQQIIISNLEQDCKSLEKQEYFLNNQLLNLKNELKTKIEKAKKNNNELNVLSLKNKNLTNDKIIKSQPYTTTINGMPITIKSLYSNRVTELKKNIGFYKKQCRYTEDMINKLKDQRKKLIENNKNLDQKIKISQKFLEGNTKFNRPQSSIGTHKVVLKDEDIINNLRLEYKAIKEDELVLEKKAIIYYEKLREIDLENEEKQRKEKEKEEENQIEFGIDENNPYYTDNEENVPESKIKFTSSQFNQFTYILFKNFEAKFIVAEEANNKIINPFNDIIKNNNITKVNYPSKEFDNIIEEFTKVIMKVLNSDNEYNHTLTKIFIGALLYNSECDTHKLVEYFSILFSYTRNYVLDEKNLIEKLKTKYKKQTKKLVECITSYILNDLSSSPYFSLFKMKDLLDKNDINLKDKYIEFLFYYMKKFNDPDAKLEDLKFSLLNDIVPIGDTTVHSKAFINDLDKDIDLQNNDEENLEGDINVDQKENKETNIDDNENIENDEKIEKDEKIENKNEIKKIINKEKKKIEENADIKDYKEYNENYENKTNEKESKNNKSYSHKNSKNSKNSKNTDNNKKIDTNNNNYENSMDIDIDKNELKNDDDNENNKDNNKDNDNDNDNNNKNDNINNDINNGNNNDNINNDNYNDNNDNDKENINNIIKEVDKNINIVNNNKVDNNINKDIINNAKKETNRNDTNENNDNKENKNIENLETDKNINNNITKSEANKKDEINNLNNDNIKDIKEKNNSTDKPTNNENNKIDDNKIDNNSIGDLEKRNENIEKYNKEQLNENDEKNNKSIDDIEKFIENKENINENSSENNQNNEPKFHIETEKEEIIETGNYENNKNKSKDKNEDNKKSEQKKSNRTKYKEDEYIIKNSQNEENNNNQKEDEKSKNNNSNSNNDSNLNGGEDSVTEITNEEYKKQIIDSINLIQNAIQNNSTDFNNLMNGIINTNLINGENYEYINIEDFNDKLISIGLILTDLQLSCLCSKFSVPNELRLIDKNKFVKSLEDNLKGNLKIE